jgi:DNA-directed RNA polymerase subunit beta'
LAYYQDQIELHSIIWVRYNDQQVEKGNFIKKTRLNDGSIIEYYQNVQIRKSVDGSSIVQYIQTTTGRVIFNYTIQKTLNLIV